MNILKKKKKVKQINTYAHTKYISKGKKNKLVSTLKGNRKEITNGDTQDMYCILCLLMPKCKILTTHKFKLDRFAYS